MVQRLLIIGYGNPLRGDDGVGWHTAHMLAQIVQDQHVRIVACQQLTPDLSEPISQADAVLFIDACWPTVPASVPNHPGTEQQEAANNRLVCYPVFPTPTLPSSFSHQLDPPALLTCAQILYQHCPVAVQFGVVATSFDYGETLSPDVRACIPGLIARVQAWIERLREDPEGDALCW